MAIRKYFTGMIVLLSIALAACQPAAVGQDQTTIQEPQPVETMTDTPTKTELEAEPQRETAEMEAEHEEATPLAEETPMEPAEEMEAGAEMNEEEPPEMVDTPAWFDITLTNVRTDTAFTINDFHGQVVLVETLAMWCSNCRQQQFQVAELHTLLGERDDFISVGLDIDPNENGAQLKDYIENHGFDWTYAIAPVELGREIANLYGSQFLNPPSTPMLVIDRQGNVHPLPFGIKSAAQLKEALDPFLQESI